MTRAEAKQKLISFGIAEPTEEQISELLNSINAETQKEKQRADGYKADADKAAELQAELDRINAEKMTDAEKQAADLKKANDRIAELEKAQSLSVQRNSVVEKFKVTSEQAKQIVKDDGSFDYDVLGQIISDKEAAAATAKEQEIAGKAGNPNGASGGNENGKSTAENLATKFFGNQKQENDILKHYVGGN